ncbi:MAG: Rrf2 family transcriptional regulator [Chloroflexi bacterium]|nr:Rrf2 family transcriptional regulator [Chloroflexota bacterium]
MKISTRAHYGLRAATQLAKHFDRGVLSLTDIARMEHLPLAYLEQLMAELRRAGLVEGTRGLHGGYRLSRSPEAITVGEIYRGLEGPIAPVDCTAEDYRPGACDAEAGCLSRTVWQRVQDAISQVLNTITLADMQRQQAHGDWQSTFITLDQFQETSRSLGCPITQS